MTGEVVISVEASGYGLEGLKQSAPYWGTTLFIALTSIIAAGATPVRDY